MNGRFKTLVRRAHNGDVDAVAEVIEEFGDLAENLSRRLEDDDTGEFMILIIRVIQQLTPEKLEDFETDTALFAYFDLAIRNKFLELAEKEAKYKKLKSLLRGLASPDCSDGIEKAESDMFVNQLLGVLPERQKTILFGKLFEIKKNSELATELKVTPQTVQKHSTRGLDTIRKYIEENMEKWE